MAVNVFGFQNQSPAGYTGTSVALSGDKLLSNGSAGVIVIDPSTSIKVMLPDPAVSLNQVIQISNLGQNVANIITVVQYKLLTTGAPDFAGALRVTGVDAGDPTYAPAINAANGFNGELQGDVSTAGFTNTKFATATFICIDDAPVGLAPGWALVSAIANAT
jgi:hypothetical protein